MERKKKIQDALDRLFSRDRREPAPPAPSEPARVRRDLFGTIPEDIPPNPPPSAEPTPVPAPAPVVPPPPVLPAVTPAAAPMPVQSPPAPVAPAAAEPVAPVVPLAHASPAAASAAAPTPAPVIVQAPIAPAAPPVPAPAPKPAEAKPVMAPSPAAHAPKPVEAKPVMAPSPAAPAPKPAEAKPAETGTEPAARQAGEAAAISEAALNLKAEHQLVVFTLGSQYYGVDIAAVEGIIKMQPITTVPRTPAFVEGVTNLRGTVLPVFDLRKRFGLPRQEPTKDTRIVVIQLPGNTAGIIVDQVNEVLRIPEDAIEPPPPIASTTDTSYLMGIANVNNRFVILLDLSQVLTTEEKVILPSVGRNPG